MSNNGGMTAGLLSYETLVHAVAGAVGSMTAMTVFFPLDTARIRLQGVVNVLLTTPMWVVNTRLKLQGAKFRNEDLQQTHYRGIFDAFSQIIANEGVGTLWNGTLPSLVLVFNPAIQFMFYEAMKRRAGRGGRKISSAEIFLIGAVAKVIATTASYPLQTVQAILRFGQYKSEGQSGILGSFQNVLRLLMDRIKRHGALGLYKGLEAKLLQTVLTAALMFVVYEKITATTFKIMGLNRKLKH
ncbi:peroxisomal membrane protein PMP34 isoform X2 [Chanos chanos]|uniref:Peroxisomal membrane protein PMP34 isoform X2 n=1 Tax=Chanos chanos TaxID=29144 RepID=A0A6J2WPF6_CHACN|nr:peroxisomal membrane protein PMP34-like isoform X2 [Chanos chanos]